MPLDTRPSTIPANIGEYDVLDKIAEGGMGAVYKARSRSTGDLVAIKVLPDDGPKPVLSSDSSTNTGQRRYRPPAHRPPSVQRTGRPIPGDGIRGRRVARAKIDRDGVAEDRHRIVGSVRVAPPTSRSSSTRT